MMDKRGQIAIFVIISILIVGAIVGIIYFQNAKKTETSSNELIKLAKADIDSCVEESAGDAIYVISSQGGYVLPKDYLEDMNLRIAYWNILGNNTSPSTETIQDQASATMCALLDECIYLEKYNLNSTKGICNASTVIRPDYAAFRVDFPISVRFADKTTIFEKSSAVVYTRIGKAITVARAIAADQSKHPGSLCLTCMADIGQQNDMLIDMGTKDNSTIIRLIDQSADMNKTRAYELKFAMKI